ncbi:rRNA N(6)-adenosine-methyltransferase ZCCHC4 isoform X2 [Amia ocellicauda]|uniref:rRNA N(6)-adenosine-methyltransferase ZCCHC4 isoform X2 n=1 Tax=Amia ocellicauda TaxID=2972642 RepID=UPI003463E77E
MDKICVSDTDGFGVEVILNEEDSAAAPCCVHGPALLFVKVCVGGQQGRRFYACSACRDRKDCSFFQWQDEKVSKARLLAREEENKAKQPPFTHEEFRSRFLQVVSLPLAQRRFCQTCQLLLLPADWAAHSAHSILLDVSAAQLRRPSQLLRPLDNKKTNAQYLFTDRSGHFLLDLFAALGFQKVLCLGTPRLHELIKIRNSEGSGRVMKSLLLDIDYRYSQFYGEEEFGHYNMFNHHFFNGKAAEKRLEDFLHEEGGEKVVMVTDPPFGGLVRPLAHSFSKICSQWRSLQSPETQGAELPMVWIFPYFFEPRILECFASFSMLDYQVDYDNHPLYKHGGRGRKQSPVRLFTNLRPSNVVLPPEEGYRFCSLCQRYVSSGNQHCPQCDACTSKDGREWKHCFLCNKCVKPTWLHCSGCGHCALEDHPCGRRGSGCFSCGSTDHKRRACPVSSGAVRHRPRTRAARAGDGRRRSGAVLHTVQKQERALRRLTQKSKKMMKKKTKSS